MSTVAGVVQLHVSIRRLCTQMSKVYAYCRLFDDCKSGNRLLMPLRDMAAQCCCVDDEDVHCTVLS
jgi:hypothetical protein